MIKRVIRIVLCVAVLTAVFLGGAYYYSIKETNKLNETVPVTVAEEEKTIIDISEFVVIETWGWDGVGMARARIDVSGLYDKYHDSIRFEGDDAAKEEEIGRGALEYFNLNSEVELSDDENLSNGDEINYKVIFHNRCDDILACSFTGTEGVHTIAELKDITEYDPFEFLEVEFQGISPYVKVVLKDNSDMHTRAVAHFAVDSDSGQLHKNGDEITVKYLIDEEKYKVNTGRDIVNFEKQYTVEKMPEYIWGYDKLAFDDIKTMQSVACAGIAGVMLKDSDSVPAMEYVGSIFGEAADKTAENGAKNVLVLIYKSVRYIDEEEYVFYYPVEFYDIYKEKGNVYYRDYFMPGNTEINGVSYEGYTDVLLCYSETVKGKEDRFNITCYGEIADIINSGE